MQFTPAQLRPPRHAKYDEIHRALLTGLLSNVGTKSDTYEYAGVRGVKFSIFPGSALFTQKPKWVMAAELVETTKLYARTCAGVQPQWIERAASHLVERSYSEPRWDAKTGSVVATEKVTLYGLVLIPARTVPYGPINAKLARELFLHHGLVLGEMQLEAGFFRFNANLVAEVEGLEAKIRQRNLLADVATRFAFYDARVPLGITNKAQFETWRRGAERKQPRVLYMSKEDLLRADAPAITPENYPDKLSDAHGGLQLPVEYRFEPGEVTDGLTLTVPIAALAQLRPQKYEWLVPGMLEEKIAALLRGLPGGLRRNFVPVPSWAKAAAGELLGAAPGEEGTGEVSLRDALATYRAKQTGVEVKGGDFAEGELPPYLRMNFKVMDDLGRVLGLSRELATLQRKLAKEAAGTFAAIYQREFNRDGITEWDFGDLPESLTVQRFKMTIVAYPAVVDRGVNCALRLLPSREAAEAAHRAGVRRLFRMEYRRDVKGLANSLPEYGRMALQYWLLGPTEELKEDLATLIVDRAMFAEDAVPREQKGYEVLKHQAAVRLHETAERVAGLVGDILEQNHRLTLLMDEVGSRGAAAGVAMRKAMSDVREHLAYLLPRHFLLGTAYGWLEHVPRYLMGMRVRLEKLEAGGEMIAERDGEATVALRGWWERYLERRAAQEAVGMRDEELELVRWMMEKWRVSLLPQELGMVMPISERRLERQWEKTKKC